MHDPEPAADPAQSDILKIVLVYAVFAGLWILLSDEAVAWLFVDSTSLHIASTLKGWFFVAITSALLYLLLSKLRRRRGGRTSESIHRSALVNWKTWQLYLFALAATLFTLLLRQHMAPLFGDRPLMILFMLPITLSAALGGFGPGLIATLIAALSVAYFALPPAGSFGLLNPHDQFQLGFLIANGLLVGFLSKMLHEARYQSEMERRLAETSLREKTRLLQLLDAIADGSTDAIYVKDVRGRYLMINHAAASLVGKSIEEVLDKDDTALFPPEEAASIMAFDRRIMDENRIISTEDHISTTRGKLVFSATKGPFHDAEGNVIGVFGISRDVTENRRAVQALRESEATYRSLFENMLNGVVHIRMIYDGERPVDYEFLSANPAYAAITGLARPIVGHKVSEVIPGYCEHNPESLETFGRVAKTGVPKRWEHHLRELNRWFSFSIYSPATGEAVIVIDNITERKNVEAQLRKLSLAVEQSPENICITNLDAKIEYVNDSFVRNSGYSREELLGQNPRIHHSGKTPKSTYDDLWCHLTAGRAWEGEFFNKRKDGSEYIVHAIISPIQQPDGSVSHYVAVEEDITEKKRSEAEINRLAFFDTLTGLPNRALLLERTAQALSTLRRLGEHSALISFNINRFKTINDAGGQALGDALLKAVGERLSKLMHEGDVVARIAGDEFAILLSNLAPEQQTAALLALHVADKIHTWLLEPFHIGDEPITLTAGLGIALFPAGNDDSPLDILRRGNTALHQAKTEGSGQTAFFEETLDEAAKQRFNIERELHRAIANGELRIFLQPQVEATGRIVGAEALVRWMHPQRGLIAPSLFIPIAEESNLIVEIGAWVFTEVCRLLAREDICTLPIRISVNISPRHFRQPNFVDQIKAGLASSGADPTHLTLEITEGMVIDNINDVIAKMNALSTMGIHFSMDDFGTGYSSLSYLKRLPIHELKIDKSFIQDLTIDPEDDALVETILAVAKLMHVKVVAEGVETAEQAAFLNQRGHVIHQGYLFGRPEHAETVIANIAKSGL